MSSLVNNNLTSTSSPSQANQLQSPVDRTNNSKLTHYFICNIGTRNHPPLSSAVYSNQGILHAEKQTELSETSKQKLVEVTSSMLKAKASAAKQLEKESETLKTIAALSRKIIELKEQQQNSNAAHKREIETLSCKLTQQDKQISAEQTYIQELEHQVHQLNSQLAEIKVDQKKERSQSQADLADKTRAIHMLQQENQQCLEQIHALQTNELATRNIQLMQDASHQALIQQNQQLRNDYNLIQSKYDQMISSHLNLLAQYNDNNSRMPFTENEQFSQAQSTVTANPGDKNRQLLDASADQQRQEPEFNLQYQPATRKTRTHNPYSHLLKHHTFQSWPSSRTRK